MFQEIIWFLQGNWDSICIVVLSLWTAGEAVTRMTPTQTDDGFVTRIGQKIDSVLKIVPLPNNVVRKSGPDAFKKP
jgi:hypothetical protein